MKFKLLYLAVFTFVIFSCDDDDPVEVKEVDFEYDFATSQHGWTHGFSDYLNLNIEEYELSASYTDRPAVTGTGKSYRISGDNHSDDLFMFLKKQVDGLRPNTTYSLVYKVRFASNAPTNGIGVGGAPGEGVTVKVGASANEPVSALATDNHFRMNIDHGNQTQGGDDMVAVGHVGVADNTTDYVIIERGNTNSPSFKAKTDGTGRLWLIVGTDSGFEGPTTLYYMSIEVSLVAQ